MSDALPCGCPPTADEIAAAVVSAGRRKRRRVRRRKAKRRDVDCCPPRDDAGYARWLLRQRELKIIRDRFYPDYLEDWEAALSLQAGELAGRGSASGDGMPEAITLGSNLSMSGTVLNVNAASGFAQVVRVSSSGVTVAAPTNALTTFFPDILIFSVKNTGGANSLDVVIAWENSYGDTGTFTATVAFGANFVFNPFATTGTMGPPPFFATFPGLGFTCDVQDTVPGSPTTWELEATRLVY